MRKRFLLIPLVLTACEVGPDYTSPSIDLPGHWGSSAVQGSGAETVIPRDWWNLFNDPTLTALEEEGLKANSDLMVAAARVAEARSNLRLAQADLYPEIDAQGGASRTGGSQESAVSRTSKPYNDFSLAAVLSYEVDLWGRLRRSNESARAQLLSQQANRDAIRLAVASDIASGYFNLLAIDAQIAVTKQTITSRAASYDYETKQYKGGAIDALTFRQAEAELAAAQATLPSLEQGRTEQENALAVLLGRSPRALIENKVTHTTALNKLPVPPMMPADLPSTLLQRRPDIAAAEQDLIAANAEIGVATADYFPKLSLNALVGLDSAKTGSLLQSSARNWQLGANFLGPIFDAGRTTANVDAAKARNDVALATYQQTVRAAFAETLNSMSATQTSQARVEAGTKQVKARAEAARIAQRRYDAGYSEQLELLDTERNLYQSQLDNILAMRDRLNASVTLYKALGGGWEPTKKK